MYSTRNIGGKINIGGKRIIAQVNSPCAHAQDKPIPIFITGGGGYKRRLLYRVWEMSRRLRQTCPRPSLALCYQGGKNFYDYKSKAMLTVASQDFSCYFKQIGTTVNHPAVAQLSWFFLHNSSLCAKLH
jgi:hypothetical protein